MIKAINKNKLKIKKENQENLEKKKGNLLVPNKRNKKKRINKRKEMKKYKIKQMM